MQGNHGLLAISHFEEDKAFGCEGTCVFDPVTEHVLESGEGIVELAMATESVAKVHPRREPGRGVCAILLAEEEGAAKHRDSVNHVVFVIVHDTHLVQKEGIRLAELVGCV